MNKFEHEFDSSTSIDLDQSLLEEYAALWPERFAGLTDVEQLWQKIAKPSPEQVPSALCLSGGGIRSATFSLGVIQALQRRQALKDFAFLSTVSGGGYIGSWMSRWQADERWSDSAIADAILADADATRPEPASPIRGLRGFSSYLTPRWGASIDTWTIVGIFLRNLMFNLAIWVPLILAIAAVPHLVTQSFHWAIDWAMPRTCVIGWGCNPQNLAAYGLPLAFLAMWVASSLTVLVPMMASSERSRERISRRAAVLLWAAVSWLLAFAVLQTLPNIIEDFVKSDWFRKQTHLSTSGGFAALGGIGTILAAVTTAAGYWGRYAGVAKREVAQLSSFGVRLLDLIALLTILVGLIGAAIAMRSALGGGWPTGIDHQSQVAYDASVIFVLVTAALVFSILVKANRFSLHALYGNRLIRAYLGSATQSESMTLDGNDDIPMAELFGGRRFAPLPVAHRLFHVVNMTLNLTRASGSRNDWQERKGASFTATPLRCGCPTLGYADSRRYGGQDGLTLGRAMTISGAAATPNMGYNSSPLVALVMTILNVRLGWWLPNPDWRGGDAGYEDRIRQDEPRLGLLRLLSEGVLGVTDTSRWLYLSDGGHFENLALYEMVRRRCRQIVVIDAGCDGRYVYADLHNAVRKINVDLGVPIDLPAILPGQRGAPRSQRIVEGVIRYSEIDPLFPDGRLFVLKPVLTGDEPPSLLQYAAMGRVGRSTFPHHSTADQFFDETQFESYRALGEGSVDDLLAVMQRSSRTGAPVGGDGPTPVQLAPPPVVERPQLAPDAEPPAVTRLTGIDTLKEGIDLMSPRGVLATVVAGVSTLAVAGTVGGVITLKAADQIGIKAATIELKLTDQDRALLNGGIRIAPDETTAGQLNEILDLLKVIQKKLAGPAVDTPGVVDVTPQLTELRGQIVALQGQVAELLVRPKAVPINISELKSVTVELKKISEDLAQAKPTDLSGVNKALTGITDRLKTIQNEVTAASPRRNIRGQ